MYVFCTLPMYHYQHDHNLYTFAQSTQCLYICSYFMPHMIFLYMCMCQILPDNNEKTHIQLNQCVSIWESVSVMMLLPFFFFLYERNKSRSRKIVALIVKCWWVCVKERKKQTPGVSSDSDLCSWATCTLQRLTKAYQCQNMIPVRRVEVFMVGHPLPTKIQTCLKSIFCVF